MMRNIKRNIKKVMKRNIERNIKKDMMRNIKKNMKRKHEDHLTLIESYDGKTW